MELTTWAEIEDPEEFVAHAIEEHGMSEQTWFNIPTTRGYHEYLHKERGGQDHCHRKDKDG